MQVMKCELCGSADIIKQDGVYICHHCGTKYTVEEAQKLIGVVKIDKSDENEKYLILARRARDEENPENAIKYYSLVAENDPQNWEAVLYVPYFQLINNTTNDTSAAFDRAIESACRMIEQHISPDQREKIAESIFHIASKGGQKANSKHVIYWFMGTAVNKLRDFFKRPDLAERLDANYSEYRKIDKMEFDYKLDQFKREGEALKRATGGCYIATCVYGSYDCPQVWTLRRYRDDFLALTWIGRMFIHAYYSISPKLVKVFGNRKWFKRFWRSKLDIIVNRLQKKGIDNTPYRDKKSNIS